MTTRRGNSAQGQEGSNFFIAIPEGTGSANAIHIPSSSDDELSTPSVPEAGRTGDSPHVGSEGSRPVNATARLRQLRSSNLSLRATASRKRSSDELSSRKEPTDAQLALSLQAQEYEDYNYKKPRLDMSPSEDGGEEEIEDHSEAGSSGSLYRRIKQRRASGRNRGRGTVNGMPSSNIDDEEVEASDSELSQPLSIDSEGIFEESSETEESSGDEGSDAPMMNQWRRQRHRADRRRTTGQSRQNNADPPAQYASRVSKPFLLLFFRCKM
ncbi:hypothetical protein KEM55_003154 [Ascosphaera atra]|nr:hypothetical protein KEM55_003154 [Ascosphaera atra]